ncbi:BTB/POZ domain-containing protein TNFAIP1 isoform 2 [Hibiscus syriacus]|uniref:BTB/POZ domain-containing protein TNFAIP1 isoform 2 n=1 Tax=Hibiscus syriacus TaxID=106335 RepID=A0A6A2WEU0_HIBSY|nr:BTB/POZ domain-containing protein TNFAIP1 isoform 2 [Hibiscus syriacus]
MTFSISSTSTPPSASPFFHSKNPFPSFPIWVSCRNQGKSSASVLFPLCFAAKSQTGGPVKKRSSSAAGNKKRRKGKSGNDDDNLKGLSLRDVEIVEDDDDVVVDEGSSSSSSSTSTTSRRSLAYYPSPLPKPPAGFVVDDTGRVLMASNKRIATVVRVPVRQNCVTVIIFNIPESFHYQGLWLFFDKYGEVVDSFIPNKRSKGGSRFGFVRFTRLEDARKVINCVDSSWIQGNKVRVFMARYHPRDVFWRKKFSSPFPVKGKSVVKEVSHTEAPFVGSVDESKLSTLKNSLVEWCRIFIKWVESSSLEEAVASPLSKVGELVGVSPVKFPELEVCTEEAGRNVNSSEVQCPGRCSEEEENAFCCMGSGYRGCFLLGEGEDDRNIGEEMMMGLRSAVVSQGTVHSQIEEVEEHETEMVHAEREAVDVYKDRCLSARGYEGSKDYFSDFPMLDGRVESKVVEDVLKEGLKNNSAFNRLNGEAMLNRGTKENLKKVETDSLMLGKDLDFEFGGSVVVLFPDDYGSGSFGR